MTRIETEFEWKGETKSVSVSPFHLLRYLREGAAEDIDVGLNWNSSHQKRNFYWCDIYDGERESTAEDRLYLISLVKESVRQHGPECLQQQAPPLPDLEVDEYEFFDRGDAIFDEQEVEDFEAGDG